jgi:hypothetical protein
MGTYRIVKSCRVPDVPGGPYNRYCLFVQILGLYYTREADLQTNVIMAVNRVLDRCSWVV